MIPDKVFLTVTHSATNIIAESFCKFKDKREKIRGNIE